MGSCQNSGRFLGTLNKRCRIILGTQKGTIILTTTHIGTNPGAVVLLRQHVRKAFFELALHAPQGHPPFLGRDPWPALVRHSPSLEDHETS